MEKPTTLLWIESGACSGESMAILGLDGSFATRDCDLTQFLENEHVRLLWHPSLSLESLRQLFDIVDSIVARKEVLTLFCVEGSIIHGPRGKGMFDSIHGKAKKELITSLCDAAEYVLAMGKNLCRLWRHPGGAAESNGIKRTSIQRRQTWGSLETGVAFSSGIPGD